MKQPTQKLSKSEWTIMNLCWRLGKATAKEIHEASLDRQEREYRTVKTLLDRIAVKGYLKVEKVGPVCLFKPVVSRRAALGTAIQEFFDVVLDNSLAPLFVHLAENEDLTDEEIEGLQKRFQQEKEP